MVLSSGVETLGGKYELHDLVQLDAHTAGVIVGIDKDTARVLTNQSTLQKNDIRLCKVSTDLCWALVFKQSSTAVEQMTFEQTPCQTKAN